MNFAETAAFFDLLYGNCPESAGQVVLIAPSRRAVLSVHSVGRGADLVQAAKVAQKHPGCYFKTQLMDWSAIRDRARRTGKGAVGNRIEVKTLVGFSLDVDAGKSSKYVSRSQALWAMESLPTPPTLVVNSNGDGGGFHAYWTFVRPHLITGSDDRKRLQAKSDRLCGRLRELVGGKLDSTSNIDRVLRVAGVDRLDGGRVTCERYEPDRLYSLEDFE